MSTLTLADAKTYLNITVATFDTELQSFIDTAEGSIVSKCGPLVSTAKTYRARGGKSVLMVPTTPVLSLTSVTAVGGSAVDVTTLDASSSGVISYLSGTGCFSANLYDVAYLAGRTSVPPDLLGAVKEHLRHLWDTQRGSTRRPGQEAQQPAPGASYAFTWRVSELMAPYLQGGFA